jgi:hypothetical protein
MSNDNAGNNPPNHAKEVTVVFNGRPKTIAKERLSFEEVIAYAFDTPPSGDGVQFTIQYTRGQSGKPNGTLLEGESVMAQDGMEFDVTATNRS